MNKIWTRLLSAFLTIAIMLSVLPTAAFAEDAETVYEITNEADLAALGGKDITGDIELRADLDMADTDMQPIASFSGNFHGNGYKIANLTITAELSERLSYKDPNQGAALFAKFSGSASDIVFENPRITLNKGERTGVAVLAGTVEDTAATIQNCAVIGGSVCINAEKTDYQAALVGCTQNAELTIQNCFSSAAVSYTGTARSCTNYAGGLIGYLYNVALTVENSAVLGDVSAHGTSGYAGGLVGIINGSNSGKAISFTNCYFAGAVAGGTKYGFAYSGRYAYPNITISNCYYDKKKNSGKTFACFHSNAATTQAVQGLPTDEFATLDLGDAFRQKDGYPLPAWYVISQGSHTLTITVQPADAIVALTDADAQPITLLGDSGRYTCTLAAGKYTLAVTPAEGDSEHEAKSVPVVMGRQNKEVSVELVARHYAVSFPLTPDSAQLVLYSGTTASGTAIDPVTPGKYSLPRGTYYYEASDFGYLTQSGTITVTEDTSLPLTLAESARSTFRFRIYPTSADAQITLRRADGDQREIAGTNGSYLLPEGSYQYTIAADGYKTRTGTISAPDMQELTLTLVSGESWDGTPATDLRGAGTQEDPYLIASGAELALAAQRINATTNSAEAHAYYRLEQDIDLGYQNWTPFGKTSASPFCGEFDGNGHTISGLNVAQQAYAYYGLFGCLTDALVKDLTVTGEIFCDESSGAAGGIAGAATGNTTFERCVSLVSISTGAGVSAGGLVGLCRKSDAIGYQWIDNTVLFRHCVNLGMILQSGEDSNRFSQGAVGGIVGYSKNCVQFEHCVNLGAIYGANIAAGLCGNVGSAQGDNAHPYLKNCYNAGSVQGMLDAYPLYGGSLGRSYVINCYALDTVSGNDLVTLQPDSVLRSDAFAALLGSDWQRDDAQNGGYPYPVGVSLPSVDASLYAETLKYTDVLLIPANAEVGKRFSLLREGETASDIIQVGCVQGAKDSLLTRLGNGMIQLAKKNETGSAVTETVTLLFTGNTGRMRRNVTVIIAPETSARAALMDKLAGIYAAKTEPDEWVVFDMAAYGMLKPSAPALSADARQNYINLAIDGLNQSYTLPLDRAKAENILSSIGADTTKLYPVNSKTPINNPALLAKESIGSDYTTAIWTLLADMQGNTDLNADKIKQLVSALVRNQKENGLFSYTYGLNTYADVDSTGWALAALARFVQDSGDSYGVKAEAQGFIDRALTGLSAALGANGSYGNINSDAMVITGLLALGIDPASDPRFVKNQCALADAPMLYVNSASNGFLSAYASGEAGEKLSLRATEQGFRSLVALEAFEQNGKKPYNIYAFRSVQTTQPLKTAPVRATGKGTLSLPADPPESANELTVKAEVAALGKSLVSGSFQVKKGATVYHLLKQLAEKNGMQVTGLEKGYVKALTYQGVTYAELAHGESSGWLYYVNGKLPNVGITDYELSEGDVVSFLYTADYTQESGGSGLGGGTISKPDPKPDDTKPDGTEPETPAWSNPFDDVSVNDWFYSYIAFVTEKGMMRGMAESLFAPDASLSRGMFVTILYRLENEPDAKDCVFTDVAPDAWYANAVAWAQAAGIVGGVTETEFAPGASITREQMAAMLYRYAGYKSYDLSAGEDTNILSFEDAQQIAEYAVSAMQWACGSALIGGSNGLLLPSSNCTRAQAAAILSRFCAAYSAQ